MKVCRDREVMADYFMGELNIRGDYVEVGCDTCGFSRQVINSGLMDRCFVVDTWDGDQNLFYRPITVEEMNDRYTGVIAMSMLHRNVFPLKGDNRVISRAFRDKSVSWCYLDARHDEVNVNLDLNAWIPKIKDNGIISGHDYHMPGVEDAVNNRFGKENITTTADGDGRSWYIMI